MSFDELLTRVLDLLQRQGRLSYRTLKGPLPADDLLEALKDELIYAQRVAVDEDSRVLVWTGESVLPWYQRQCQPVPRNRRHFPTRPHTSPKRFSLHALPWKANASRSRCCLPTSKIRPN